MNKKLRTIEVCRNRLWIRTSMENIKKGDVYRMFEPNGQPVRGEGEFEGFVNFQAVEDFDGTGVPSIGTRE